MELHRGPADDAAPNSAAEEHRLYTLALRRHLREGRAEAPLRPPSEVRAFGIRCSLIEPGRIATRFSHRGREEIAAVAPHYEAQHARYLEKYLHHGGASPDHIARYIEKACLARRPRFHYLGPMDAKGLKLSERVFGDGIFRMAGRFMLGKPRRAPDGQDKA